MAKAQEVAVKEETQLSTVVVDDYAQYEGVGFENQTADDYAIPFINMLQALSPKVAEDPEKFRAGNLVNTATGEIYDGKKGIVVIPVHTERQYVEWVPVDAGGGFVGVHAVSSDVVLQAKSKATSFGDLKTPEGNDLVETFNVYVMIVDDAGDFSNAVLSFTSSKIKKYKNWMTTAKMIQVKLSDGRKINPPLFAHKYRLAVVSEKNKRNQSYFNWDSIKFEGANAIEARISPTDPLFQAAVAFADMIKAGSAKADFKSMDTAAEEGVEGNVVGDGKPVF